MENNDCNASIDLHVAAGLLKLFLRDLPEPLIPFELYREVVDTIASIMQLDSALVSQ